MEKRIAKKFCTGCERWKPLDKFAEHRRRVDGRQIWCQACIALLIRDHEKPQPRMRKAYREARKRAYQIWFREQKETLMLDRRIFKSHGVRLRMVRSRRLGRIQAYDGWTMIDNIRSMFLTVFGCDPTTLIEHGRGGGTGVRRHPDCVVEGEASEEKWKEGIAQLTEEGWTITREDNEDIVAEGF